MRSLWTFTALVSTAVSLGAAAAQRSEPLPAELEGVGITEKLEAQVPLDAEFTTAEGISVRFGDLLRPNVPVVLTLNYSDCPMLCNLQLDALAAALKDIKWSIGDQFDVVTVSIDPREKLERTLKTKEKYLKRYGRPASEKGWHFLVGQQPAITAVADAVGFRYRYLEDQKEYAHTAALILLSPDGKVSRYLYGVMYEPKTLRLSLTEASQGKAGSVMDQLILFCFQYDADKGRYAPFARNLMRLGGALTVAALGGVLAAFWIRDSKKRRSS